MSCQTNCRTAYCACGFPPYLAALSAATDLQRVATAPRLPRELDGRFGLNRASDAGRHYAQNDLDALRTWLTHYASSPSTLASYRREAERLLFWALLDREKPLSSLTSADLVGYAAFLADPQPREIWITARGTRLGRNQADWRPFAGPLSAHSVQQSLAVVKRLFDWLVETGYLQYNPLRTAEDKPKPGAIRAVLLVQEDFLQIVTAALDNLPRATPRESEHAERARWLFALLYHGGFSITEVSRHTMGAFHLRPQGDSGEWWIVLHGARGSRRLRPVSRLLMRALIRYRLSQGLPPLPDEHEPTPLILPIGGRDRHLKPRALHGIVKTLFLAASRVAGRIDLKNGSPNWLRSFSGGAYSADGDAVSGDDLGQYM